MSMAGREEVERLRTETGITADTQCQAFVYVRDTYRRSSGGAQFKLHYTRRRCSRKACSNGLCWQHQDGIGSDRATISVD